MTFETTDSTGLAAEATSDVTFETTESTGLAAEATSDVTLETTDSTGLATEATSDVTFDTTDWTGLTAEATSDVTCERRDPTRPWLEDLPFFRVRVDAAGVADGATTDWTLDVIWDTSDCTRPCEDCKAAAGWLVTVTVGLEGELTALATPEVTSDTNDCNSP